MSRRPDKRAEKALAADRIARLHALAEAAAREGRDDRAARYAEMARALSLRYQVPFPRAMRRAVCRACGAWLLPGRNARVRLRPGRVLVTCAACGETKRLPHGPRAPAKGPRRARRA